MRRGWLVVVLLSVLAPAAAAAQTAWDSPLLLPPRPADGFGIFLIDAHHGGIGVLGTWRSPIWNYGLRAGISEGPDSGDIAVFGGIDYTGPVNTATEDFPIDIDWVFGAGLGISDGARVSLPLGLTAAHSFQGEGARFTPYLTPRVVLDGWFGGDNRESELELGFAIDLGLDLRFTAGGGPLAGSSIRFGAALGDRSAIAIGLVF
ncbi:hypothetical protein BH23GEM10_BH23GEM10_09060 [soil metagenome]